MSRFLALLAAATLIPGAASAASSFDVGTVACSGTPTASFLDGVSYQCTGDLLLSGGAITSDTGVVISAGGTLSIDDLIVTAPTVQFSTFGGALTIGAGTTIDVGGSLLVGGTPAPALTVAPSAAISIGSGADVRAIGGGELQIAIGTNTPILAGIVTLAPPIPEPRVYGTMVLGLGLLSIAVRRRARRG